MYEKQIINIKLKTYEEQITNIKNLLFLNE